MPPNSSRPSVREVLWQKNFTTFWKSEKDINCRSGKSDEGCRMKVIEVKDGTRVKGNCTTVVGGDQDEDNEESLVCHVRDWIQNAESSRNMAECKEGDGSIKPHYEYSFRDQEANS